MKLNELLKKPLPQIPPEIAIALKKNAITSTPFTQKNDILLNAALQDEVGYKKMGDGAYLVSMTCPMPGITTDMIEWWFWWHPQSGERYRLWYPGEHDDISYDPSADDYFKQNHPPAFRRNTHYPTERIGGMKMPLRIDFVTPEEFGFSKDQMIHNNIPLGAIRITGNDCRLRHSR